MPEIRFVSQGNKLFSGRKKFKTGSEAKETGILPAQKDEDEICIHLEL